METEQNLAGANKVSPIIEEETVTCQRGQVVDLIYYADSVASILRDNGWPGKAEALQDRYMRVAESIGLKPDEND